MYPMLLGTIYYSTSEMESLRRTSPKRIAVVTGANKGIGLEICKQLASSGVTVILTARDVKRGTEAVEKLKEESGLSNVVFHQLDIAETTSVAALAEFIKKQYEKLDILVNNAAVAGHLWDNQALDSCKNILTQQQDQATILQVLVISSYETYETAQECLNINYHGTKRVTEELIPLLQLSPSPRIVNLTSAAGKLEAIPSESIKKELRDDRLTEESLEEIIQSYLRDFNQKKLEINGWPTELSAYKLSKVAINAYTRILARRYPAFCINCVHPGLVKTDMTVGNGLFTAEEGAEGAVMLALAPDGSPSGNFYHQTQLSSFE